MLLRRSNAGIERVDVEVVPGDHVARREAALEEMNMLAGVDNAARVIEINKQRLAVGARFGLHDVNRRTRRSEINLVAGGLHVVLGIAAMEQEAPGAACQNIFGERPRDEHAALVRHGAAARRHRFDAAWNRLAKSNGFQKCQRRLVNAFHVALGQRLVLPAFHAGANRGLGPWNFPRPQGPPGFTAAAALGKVFDYAHFMLLNRASYVPILGRLAKASNFIGLVRNNHH